jgi:hypothetical protein
MVVSEAPGFVAVGQAPEVVAVYINAIRCDPIILHAHIHIRVKF